MDFSNILNDLEDDNQMHAQNQGHSMQMPAMQQMPGMQGMQQMPGMQGMPGMDGMGGMPAMPGMGGMNMPAMPGMDGMGGMGMNMPGMPGMGGMMPGMQMMGSSSNEVDPLHLQHFVPQNQNINLNNYGVGKEQLMSGSQIGNHFNGGHNMPSQSGGGNVFRAYDSFISKFM